MKLFIVTQDENVYLPPEPYMDLQLALRETSLAIQRAELQDVPEERVVFTGAPLPPMAGPGGCGGGV